MKIFGERLRILRLKHGMTQQTLADLLCSERTTIVGWELSRSIIFLEETHLLRNLKD